jgi:hypothetical protein
MNMKRFTGFLALFAFAMVPAFAFAQTSDDPFYFNTYNDTVTNPYEQFQFGTGDPIVRTVGATNIGDTYATMQASFDSANSDYNPDRTPRLYVEWGVGGNLDQVTATTYQNQGSRTMKFQLSGLTPSTTYSYRAVVLFDGRRFNGDVESFTTRARGQAPITYGVSDDRVTFLDHLGNLIGVNNTRSSGTTSNNSSSNSGSATVKNGPVTMTITPASEFLIQGEQTSYEIKVRNGGASVVRSAVLEFPIPDEASFVDTSRGSYVRSEKLVRVRLGTIATGQTEEVKIVLRGDTGEDKAVVSIRANVDYRVNSSDQTITATAKQTFDGKSASVLGASALGAGFLPQTLIGWIFILAIIMLIIMIVRRYQKAHPPAKK